MSGNRCTTANAPSSAVLATVLEERFHSRVLKTSRCWEWQGPISPLGYGRIFYRNRSAGFRINVYAHRVSYEIHRGPIPPGLVLDHLCRNRKCVNPDHLEAVTNRENILRGVSPAAQKAAASHCPAAHPYSESNTYVTRSGHRSCRECTRVQQRVAWAQKGPSRQCVATTRSGSRCRLRVRKFDYCGMHGGRGL
jgi:hypothetical protein